MRKISILIAALTLSISLKPLAAQNKKVFIIDKQTVYQEIDNFSASDAWPSLVKTGLKRKKKKLPTYYSNVNLTKKVTPSVWP